MFELVSEQLTELIVSFANDRGFYGAAGLMIFLVVILADFQMPSDLRNKRGVWFLEIIVAPVLVFAVSTLVGYLIARLGSTDPDSLMGPIYSVPLILLFAHLFNRGLRLFLWQGLLASKTGAVPRIVWNIVEILVYVTAAYAILSFVFDQPVTGLIVSSGVVVGIIGLSMQPLLGDIIAGVGLTIERPFTAGDWIELEGGQMGEVINTDWRATRIRTWNNTVHVVPNSKMAGATILNYDRPESLYGFWFYITVSRSVSPDLVRRLITEACLKADLVLDDPAPAVKVWDTEVHPIKYMVFVHCENYRIYFTAKDQILANCWSLFTRAGFNFAASPQDMEMRRGEAHEASEVEAAVLLKEIPLLAPLQDEDRDQLAHDGIIHTFAPGDEIIREQTDGDSMYIILLGTVQVQRHLEDGKVMDLARLGTYDYFGEMSLLTGEKRSASVIAHTECQVLEIAKSSLEPLLTRRPELSEEIASIMAERKLKSELLTAEDKKMSVADRLKSYSDAFASSIRGFFGR